MLKAEEYYKIMHFLKVETLDRFYPVEEYFYETVVDEETGESSEERVTYEGDSFHFKTNRETFSGFDYVEVLLESKQDIHQFKDITLSISEYEEGYSPILTLDAEDGDSTITPNNPVKLVFRIKKSQTMSESSRNLTNIKSIDINTDDNTDFKIHDVCFRDENALFTLEQLDHFYADGKYYVLSRLHMEEVPTELMDHVYTASAGYGWMSVWEYEARVMNDSSKNSISYGKWLFAIVDQAIDMYKKANGIADDEEMFVMTELSTHRGLRW